MKSVHGGVEFKGNSDLLYLSLFRLRSAVRILLRVDSFLCKSYPELFDRVSRIPWELYVWGSSCITVSASSAKSRLHHKGNIARSCKDGIAKHFQSFTQENVAPDTNNARMFLRMFEDRCTISLDITGEPLYRRGYRTKIGSAPIRETIAAALLLSVDKSISLDSFPAILDPFCGSGVFLLESCMILSKKFPGLDRKFAIESLPLFKVSVYNRCKRESSPTTPPEIKQTIAGIDINPGVIEAAKANIENFNKNGTCRIQLISGDSLADNLDTPLPEEGPGLLVSNLPYGNRINYPGGSRKRFFELLTKALKDHYQKWYVLFVSPDINELKKLPVENQITLSFSNGGIKVYGFSGKIKT